MKWNGNTPVYICWNNATDQEASITTNYIEARNHTNYKTYSLGEDIGFIYTDFVYTDDLIGNAGDNVCTILDKIKNYLGNFEYFYDVDGNFVFQEIKNYLNTSQTTVELKLDKLKVDDYKLDLSREKTAYNFDNSNLIISYSNAPQYNMIKNDFVVWGTMKTATDASIPIRYHLAIDEKPKLNKYQGFFYTDTEDGLVKFATPNFVFDSLTELNQLKGAAGTFYQVGNKIYKWENNSYQEIKDAEITEVQSKDWRSELYYQGAESERHGTYQNYYWTELKAEWPKIYDLKNEQFYEELIKTPSNAKFYLDFIDSGAEMSKFSIANIGRRTLAIVDDKVNCVFEPEIQDYVLIERGTEETAAKRKECEDRGQKFIQVDKSIYSALVTGGTLNSAYNRVRELLYEYTSYNESISLQTLPIYHLEPNIRIGVNDVESNIFGDYMISTISIPLDVEGSMTIQATRVLERI